MNSRLPKRPGRPTAGRTLRLVGATHQAPSTRMQSAPPGQATPRMQPAAQSKPGALWYAICLPQLRADNDEAQRVTAERLQQLAALLERVSSTVSIQPPDALVFEVRSSLRYFGGIKNIHHQVQTLLAPLPAAWGLEGEFQQAASPTPAASLLLARSGCNLLVYRKESLRSALGNLALNALEPADSKIRTRNKARNRTRQLRHSGLRVMRDLWRLPRQALAQRFGPDFLRQLDSCLGHVAMPLNTYQAPPFFSTAMDFEYPVENTHFLLHAIDELVGHLCHYLRQRELAAAHLQLRLRHEHREDTSIALELRLASRSPSHLSLLLETRIDTLTLQAPVRGLQLEVSRFNAFTAQHRALSGAAAQEGADEETGDAAIHLLLEQLQARLGNEAVRSLHVHPSHAPEQAGSDRAFLGTTTRADSEAGKFPSNQNRKDRFSAAPVAARPCWILKQPSILLSLDFRKLTLLSGPERIETQWWGGQDIQRDYYVARNREGMRLWIYHDRKGERGWHLHGIFD